MFNFLTKKVNNFGLRAKNVKEYHTFCSLQYGDLNDITKEAKRLNHYCRKNKMYDRHFYVQMCSGMPDMGILLMARK